jgi:ATP-dependent Clp protease ATP-binding subunit ClpC
VVFERFGDEAQAAVSLAGREAEGLGHDRIGTEHVLLGLLGTPGSTARVLRAAGATLDGCRSKVAELAGPPRPRSTTGPAAAAGARPLTERAQRAIQRADRLSLRRRDVEVEPAHLLVSLLDVEGTAGQVLRGLSVDVVELRGAVSGLLDRGDESGRPNESPTPDPDGRRSAPEPRCGTCGAAVDPGPLVRVVPIEDADDRPRVVVIVYCRSCGAIFGANPIGS